MVLSALPVLLFGGIYLLRTDAPPTKRGVIKGYGCAVLKGTSLQFDYPKTFKLTNGQTPFERYMDHVPLTGFEAWIDSHLHGGSARDWAKHNTVIEYTSRDLTVDSAENLIRRQWAWRHT
jgi:hypothetical protein